jgi:hypothetical protein
VRLGFYMGYAPPGTSPLETIAMAQEAERLVLDWDNGGTVAIELEPVVDGTRVHVVESSPEFAPALELRACAWTALAAA